MAKNTITGVLIRNRDVTWTTFTDTQGERPVRTSGRAVLPLPDEALNDPVQWADAIRQHCPAIQGSIALGLPTDQLLLRVVELPTLDPQEIQGMIQLQVSKYSPFPEDRLAVSHEVLSITETGCTALVVGTQKDKLDFWASVFSKLEGTIERIDAELCGVWRMLMARRSIPTSDRHFMLLLEPTGGLWVATRKGQPAAFKIIAPQDLLMVDEYATEVAQELNALMLSMDMDFGLAPASGLDVWVRGLDGDAVVSRLRLECANIIQVHGADEWPSASEGIALRMVDPPFAPVSAAQPVAEHVLDLVPDSWRDAAAAQVYKKRLLTGVASVLGIWLLILGALFGFFQWEARVLRLLEEHMAELQRPAEDVRNLQKRVKFFERYLDRQNSALECLREVSQLLPPDVLLTSFQFKKGKNVTIRGEALSVNPIYDYKQALDKSTLLKKIDLGSVQPGKRKDTPIQTFQMILLLPEEAP